MNYRTDTAIFATATICADLTLFVDGELGPAAAAAFRIHLADCAACRANMIEALRLSAQLSTLTGRSDLQWLRDDVSERLSLLSPNPILDRRRARLTSCLDTLDRLLEER
jgi:anti-sigma factor RsiW